MIRVSETSDHMIVSVKSFNWVAVNIKNKRSASAADIIYLRFDIDCNFPDVIFLRQEILIRYQPTH